MASSFSPGMNLVWRLKTFLCVLGIVVFLDYGASLPAHIGENTADDHYGQRLQGLQDLLARNTQDSDNVRRCSGNDNGLGCPENDNGLQTRDGDNGNSGNDNGNSGNRQDESDNGDSGETLSLEEVNDGMNSLRGMVQAVQARLVDIAFIQTDLLSRVSNLEKTPDMQNVVTTTGTTPSMSSTAKLTTVPSESTTTKETTTAMLTTQNPTTAASTETQKVTTATEQIDSEAITTKGSEYNAETRRRSNERKANVSHKTARVAKTFNIESLEHEMGEDKFETMREELNEYHDKWFPGKRRALKTKKDAQRKRANSQIGIV